MLASSHDQEFPKDRVEDILLRQAAMGAWDNLKTLGEPIMATGMERHRLAMRPMAMAVPHKLPHMDGRTTDLVHQALAPAAPILTLQFHRRAVRRGTGPEA